MWELIYSPNVPSRWDSQYSFMSLTFDRMCSGDLTDEHPLIGGEAVDFTYGELQRGMSLINRAFIEITMGGGADGRVFMLLTPIYNITFDFDQEGESVDALSETTMKHGLPYPQNFINSDLDPHIARSMRCCLQLDLCKPLKRGNGLFGLAELTGSIGVVTLSVVHLGYLYKGDEEGSVARIGEPTDLVSKSFEIKCETIRYRMGHGLFPYLQRYLGALDNHFSMIDVNGMNGVARNFSDDAYDPTDPYGFDMCVRILDRTCGRMVEFQGATGHMYDLETTPVEGTTYCSAKEDRKHFANIIHTGTSDEPYRMNSSRLPVGYMGDPFQVLEDQEVLQGKHMGGTVPYLYMGERMPLGEACKEMVRRSLAVLKAPYITIIPTFLTYPVHGYLVGEYFICEKYTVAHSHTEPQTHEVWTRVMGHFRPAQSSSVGREDEYYKRQTFSGSAADAHGELVSAFPPAGSR